MISINQETIDFAYNLHYCICILVNKKNKKSIVYLTSLYLVQCAVVVIVYGFLFKINNMYIVYSMVQVHIYI